MDRELLHYLEEHAEEGRELLITLGRIAAPSNHEEKRAAFVKSWLEENGAEGVYIDPALNVIYPVGCTEDNPVTIFMAHTDVVFPDTDSLPLHIEDGKICCPGIGDDTANLVALLLAARYTAQNHLTPAGGKGVVFVANSGEEGLGNLKGSRAVCKAYEGRISEFISFDGYLEGLTTIAVGSERYRVEVLTEGGHSYQAFGNRNAIAYLAGMIDTLYRLKPPVSGGRTTYNVGGIQGGTSVNTIAQQAEMLYEYRSDDRGDLAFMRRHFEAVIESYRAKGIRVNVELLGRRPCNGEVDPDRLADLRARAGAVVKEFWGVEPINRPSSTDSNIPLSMGIPAMTMGAVAGAGAHTREEYVRIDSLLPGYKVAFGMILPYFEAKKG